MNSTGERFHALTARKSCCARPAPRVERLEMTWRQMLLSAIARPEVAYLLFSLGTLGLTIELWSPGAVVPVCRWALSAAGVFRVSDSAGQSRRRPADRLWRVAAQPGDVHAEFRAPGVGGVVSLVFGSLMLIDSPVPELQVGLALILPVTLALAAISSFSFGWW